MRGGFHAQYFTAQWYTIAMKFIQGTQASATKYIAGRLRSLLKNNQPVLWLVSGGSNIPIQKTVMDNLPDELTKTLTIIPLDERYGPYNHANSNSAQLRKSGFNPKHAEWIDILEQSLSPQDTMRLHNDFIARKIAAGDYMFITFGMGPDGHIAGILPHSPALQSTDLAVYYQAEDFERITFCADTIAAHCNEAVLCAFGESKSDAILKLASHNSRREDLPAMILHGIDSCTVFNDIIEGEKS